MNAVCHIIPDQVAQDMMQDLVQAICDRPGDTPEQRAKRASTVSRSVIAFGPRDPVEMMLAGMIVANYQLILDATHGAFAATADVSRGRMNAGVVALERTASVLMRELRAARKREMDAGPEAARGDAAAESVAMPAPGPAPEAARPAEPRQPPLPPVRSSLTPAPDAPPPRQRSETSTVAMTAATSHPPPRAIAPAEPKLPSTSRPAPPGHAAGQAPEQRSGTAQISSPPHAPAGIVSGAAHDSRVLAPDK